MRKHFATSLTIVGILCGCGLLVLAHSQYETAKKRQADGAARMEKAQAADFEYRKEVAEGEAEISRETDASQKHTDAVIAKSKRELLRYQNRWYKSITLKQAQSEINGYTPKPQATADGMTAGYLVLGQASPNILIGGDRILEIDDKDGNRLVRIDADGNIFYGAKYDADAAAQTFWRTLADAYPSIADIHCIEKFPAEKTEKK